MGASKTKNREKDDPEKGKTQAETYAVAETLRQFDAKNDGDDKVYEWDEHQNHPPARSPHDLAPNIDVVDRDQTSPAGLSGFGKDFPQPCDQQHRDEQSNNSAYWADTARGVLVGLREKQFNRQES